MSFELDDAYEAPREDDDINEEDASSAERTSAGFYVVSMEKLLVLQLLSLGWYSVYWFYKHWDVLRREYRYNVRPLLRAVFSIFFVHQLFRVFDRAARKRGYTPTWDPGSRALTVVIIAIATSLLMRQGVEGAVVAILAHICLVVPIGAAQRVANLANNDRAGQTGSKLEIGAVLVASLFGALRLLWVFGSLVLTTRFY